MCRHFFLKSILDAPKKELDKRNVVALNSITGSIMQSLMGGPFVICGHMQFIPCKVPKVHIFMFNLVL